MHACGDRGQAGSDRETRAGKPGGASPTAAPGRIGPTHPLLTAGRQTVPEASPAAPDTVLVVDFGAQYAQLIARRVREARVYSEIVPSSMPVEEMLAKNPAAIILSGGPSSVYAEGAPRLDRALFDAGCPRLRHVLRLPADGDDPRRHGRQLRCP